VKDFLTRHQIPYLWLDIEKDSNVRQLVEGVSSEEIKLPIIFFPDGKTLIQPNLKELAEKAPRFRFMTLSWSGADRPGWHPRSMQGPRAIIVS
jgi:hypothetical protein